MIGDNFTFLTGAIIGMSENRLDAFKDAMYGARYDDALYEIERLFRDVKQFNGIAHIYLIYPEKGEAFSKHFIDILERRRGDDDVS
jgi:hypothetical protein